MKVGGGQKMVLNFRRVGYFVCLTLNCPLAVMPPPYPHLKKKNIFFNCVFEKLLNRVQLFANRICLGHINLEMKYQIDSA